METDGMPPAHFAEEIVRQSDEVESREMMRAIAAIVGAPRADGTNWLISTSAVALSSVVAAILRDVAREHGRLTAEALAIGIHRLIDVGAGLVGE